MPLKVSYDQVLSTDRGSVHYLPSPKCMPYIRTILDPYVSSTTKYTLDLKSDTTNEEHKPEGANHEPQFPS